MATPPTPEPRSILSGSQLEELFKATGEEIKVSSFKTHEGSVTFTASLPGGTRSWKFTVGEKEIFLGFEKGDQTVLRPWVKGIGTMVTELNGDSQKAIRSVMFSQAHKILHINGIPYTVDTLTQERHQQNSKAYETKREELTQLNTQKAGLERELAHNQELLTDLPHGLFSSLSAGQKVEKERLEEKIAPLKEQLINLQGKVDDKDLEVRDANKKLHLDKIASNIMRSAFGFEIFFPGGGTVVIPADSGPGGIPMATPPTTPAAAAAPPPPGAAAVPQQTEVSLTLPGLAETAKVQVPTEFITKLEEEELLIWIPGQTKLSNNVEELVTFLYTAKWGKVDVNPETYKVRYAEILKTDLPKFYPAAGGQWGKAFEVKKRDNNTLEINAIPHFVKDLTEHASEGSVEFMRFTGANSSLSLVITLPKELSEDWDKFAFEGIRPPKNIYKFILACYRLRFGDDTPMTEENLSATLDQLKLLYPQLGNPWGGTYQITADGTNPLKITKQLRLGDLPPPPPAPAPLQQPPLPEMRPVFDLNDTERNAIYITVSFGNQPVRFMFPGNFVDNIKNYKFKGLVIANKGKLTIEDLITDLHKAAYGKGPPTQSQINAIAEALITGWRKKKAGGTFEITKLSPSNDHLIIVAT